MAFPAYAVPEPGQYSFVHKFAAYHQSWSLLGALLSAQHVRGEYEIITYGLVSICYVFSRYALARYLTLLRSYRNVIAELVDARYLKLHQTLLLLCMPHAEPLNHRADCLYARDDKLHVQSQCASRFCIGWRMHSSNLLRICARRNRSIFCGYRR